MCSSQVPSDLRMVAKPSGTSCKQASSASRQNSGARGRVRRSSMAACLELHFHLHAVGGEREQVRPDLCGVEIQFRELSGDLRRGPCPVRVRIEQRGNGFMRVARAVAVALFQDEALRVQLVEPSLGVFCSGVQQARRLCRRLGPAGAAQGEQELFAAVTGVWERRRGHVSTLFPRLRLQRKPRHLWFVLTN